MHFISENCDMHSDNYNVYACLYTLIYFSEYSVLSKFFYGRSHDSPKSYIVLQFVWQWNLIKVKKNNIFLLFNAFILTQIWGSGSAYKLHQVA